MLHLPPLPGAPRFDPAAAPGAVREHVFRDAEALVSGGVHGLMLENFGDVPFYPGPVPAHTVAAITALAAAVRDRFPEVPLGINVLRNDGRAALAVAAAVGAQFIRVNVLCGVRVADQGLIQGIAHDLLRDRAALGPVARTVRVLADVDVKHSVALAPVPIESEVEDTLRRGLADGLIVSGTGTGKVTDPAHVARVKQAAGPAIPVFVGSGAGERTLAAHLPQADGFIIGTAFKVDGVATNPVDVERVRRLMGLVVTGGEHGG